MTLQLCVNKESLAWCQLAIIFTVYSIFMVIIVILREWLTESIKISKLRDLLFKFTPFAIT